MATVNEVSDRYIITTEYRDQSSAGFDAGAERARRFEASVQRAAAATSGLATASEGIGTSSAAWDRIAQRSDTVAKAYARLESAQRALTRAQVEGNLAIQAGQASQDDVDRTTAKLVSDVERLSTALGAARADAAGMAEANARWNAVLEGGSGAARNFATQVAAIGEAARLAAAANSQLEASTKLIQKNQDITANYATSLDNLRAKFDPVFKVSKDYENQLKELEAAQRVLNLSTPTYAAAQERLRQSFEESVTTTNKYVGSSKAAGVAIRDFGIQSIDVFQQLASGAPVLLTFIQQGGQVFQVSQAMGVSMKALAVGIGQSLVSAFTAVISPMGLAITGFGLLAGAAVLVVTRAFSLASQTREISTAIAAVGRNAELSAVQLTGYVAKLAETGGISRQDSTGIVSSLARNSALSASGIGSVVSLIPDLSTALGVQAADAAKQLSEALGGSYDAINKLDTALNFLTSEERENIRVMLSHGNQIGAVDLATEKLHNSFDNLREKSLGPLQRTLEAIAAAYNKVVDAAAKATTQLGNIGEPGSAPAPEPQGPTHRQAEDQSMAALTADTNRQDKALADLIRTYGEQDRVLNTTVSLRDDEKRKIEAEKLVIEKTIDATRADTFVRTGNAASIKAQTDALQLQTNAANASLASTQEDTRQIQQGTSPIDRARIAAARAAIDRFGNQPDTQAKYDAIAAEADVAQGKAVNSNTEALEKYNKAQQDRIRIAQAGLTAQARLTATTQAENEIRDKSLTGTAAEALMAKTLAGAMAEVGAARGQELASLDRQVRATVTLAGAVERGAAAEALAKAAADAHEQAATKEGASEARLTRILFERAAAEQQVEQARTNKGLQDEIGTTQASLNAGSATEEFWANIKREIELATRADREFAAATTDPARREALLKEADATQRLIDQRTRLNAEKANKESIQSSQDELAVIAKETDLLGASADAQARGVAELRKMIELEHSQGADPLNLQQSQKDVIAFAGSVAAANVKLEQQKAIVSELEGVASQAFDQVSQAIVQAFVNGNGAAVNFGNVFKSVIASIISEIAKLAILNPILNSLFAGTQRATLGSIADLSSGSGGIGGLGSIISLLQLGGSASSVSQAFGGPGIGGLFGQSGSLSGVGNFLGTPISTAGLDSSGMIVNGAGQVVSPLTYGGALGGVTAVGAGYGLGTTVGGYLQNSLGKTGPGPQIGAGIGAAGLALGAALAPETFGLSLLAAGLLGGAAGGALGGLVGPQKASPFSLTNVGISNEGLLSRGSTANQISGSNADEAQAQIDAINKVLVANGLTIQGSRGAGLGAVGREEKNPTHAGTNFIGNSVGDVLDTLKFSSQDPHLQAFLQANGGAGFSDINTLNTVITTVRNFVAAVSGTDFADKIDQTLSRAEAIGAGPGADLLNQVATFVTQTVPALTQSGGGIGSLATAIQGLMNTYAPAIATAQQLGYKEQELTDAREKAIQTATKTATDALYQADVALDVRRANAQATTSGDPADAAAAKLLAFDAQANAERTSFAKSMTDVFGESYASTEQYANQMAFLEQTLQAERLALQKQGNLKIISETEAFLDLQKTVNPNLSVRAYNASAQASDDPQVRLNAALYAFDTQATQERVAFRKSLTDAYGDAFGQTTAFANEMTDLETALAYERYAIQKNGNDAILAAAKQAADTLAANQLGYYQQGQQLTVRIRSAQAQASGDAAQIASASLFAFDTQAAEQRAVLSKQLVDTFGESFISTSNYADRMVQLEQTLQAERVAVQTQGNAQILAQTKQAQTTATSLISSVAQYVDTLSTSAQSALSPQSQYSLSASRFNAVSGAAAAGDYNSLQQLTAYADSFLNASRLVNGSGQQYALDFQRVVDALKAVSGLSPDSLTASILISETRTQTSTLVDALAELGTKLDYLNVQVKQGALTPARIAA